MVDTWNITTFHEGKWKLYKKVNNCMFTLIDFVLPVVSILKQTLKLHHIDHMRFETS